MTRAAFVSHAALRGGAELFLHDILTHSHICNEQWRAIFLTNGPIVEDIRARGGHAEICDASTKYMKIKRNSGLLAVGGAAGDIVRSARALSVMFRDCDLVCANSQKALIIAGMGAAFARKPLVWILHDILTDTSFNSVTRTAAILSSRLFAKYVVVNSEATREAFLAAGGERTKTHLIYNGFAFPNISEIADTNGEREALFVEIGLKDLPTVGLFGRLSTWKGQHILIEALADTRDVQAIIVGDASYEDVRYENSLQAMIADRGLSQRVKLLGFRADIMRLMRLVDIVAHTSIKPEPFGRVIVEGMAVGRPVVAAAAGGVGEIIAHERTGLLVKPGDSQALRGAILRLAQNPALRRAIGIAGYESARSRFNLDATISNLASVFKMA